MLKPLMEIGKVINNEFGVVYGHIEKYDLFKNKESTYIVEINFNLNKDKIEINEFPTNEKTGIEYLWIGRTGGRRGYEWSVTYKNLPELITEILPNLNEKNISEELNKEIEKVMENFYYDFKIKDKKYRYLMKLDEHFDLKNIKKDINKILDNKEDIDSTKVKNIRNNIAKDFNKIIKNRGGSKKVVLYTLSINGKAIAKKNDYKDFVYEYFTSNDDKLTDEKQICSYCGCKDRVYTNNPNSKFKYFATEKISFTEMGEKNNFPQKSFSLCQNCMNNFNSGINFIVKNLKTTIGKEEVYIIPYFIGFDEIKVNHMEIISNKIKKTKADLKNLKDFIEFSNEKNRYEILLEKQKKEGQILFDVIFAEENSNNTGIKIKKTVEFIPLDIFQKVNDADKKSKDYINRYFGKNYNNSNINPLNLIYYTLPIFEKDKNKHDNFLMDIYSSLFKLEEINYDILIRKWFEVLKIIFLKKDKYNVSVTEKHIKAFEQKIIDIIFIEQFYKNLGLISERGERMEDIQLETNNENIKSYFDENNYSSEKKALFLMGFLMGEIGKKQNKNNIGTYKPILNKLNFNGMDIEHLIILANAIFKKLREVNILNFYEKENFHMTNLIEKNKDNWEMNKIENVFHIIIGYGFSTTVYKMKEDEKDD